MGVIVVQIGKTSKKKEGVRQVPVKKRSQQLGTHMLRCVLNGVVVGPAKEGQFGRGSEISLKTKKKHY